MAYTDSGDLFGGSARYKAQSKWNVSDFLSDGYHKTKRKTQFFQDSQMNQNDALELDRVYKSIETEVSKLKLDYDKIYREMDFKRKELKQDIDQMRVNGAKGQDLSLMHNADINLMSNQMRIVDSKRMLLSDRFKNIRDEKKLYMDKLKAEGKLIPDKTDVNIVQANANSPLAAATMVRQSTKGFGGVQHVSAPNMATNTAPAIEHVKRPDSISMSDVEISNAIPATEKTSIPVETEDPNRDMVLRNTLLGEEISLGTQIDKNQTVLGKRLQETAEEAIDGTSTIMGFDLQTSLNSMVTKGVPLQKIMYVNTQDGTYDLKAFKQDEAGEFTIPEPAWHEISIMHCGRLQFDPVNKRVSLQFEDDPIPYVLVENNENRSDFYHKEWADVKTKAHRLDEETRMRLSSF